MNTQNIIILFDDKSDQALSAIMAKYQLQEPLEKMTENTLNDKPNNVVILNELTTSFAKGEISEKTLADSIQSQIGISLQTAGSVAKEIISTLVPTLKKLTEADIEKLNIQSAIDNESIMPKIKAPIEVEKIMQERQKSALKEKIKGPIEAEKTVEKPSPARKKPPVGENTNTKPENTERTKNQKPDSYREPVE